MISSKNYDTTTSRSSSCLLALIRESTGQAELSKDLDTKHRIESVIVSRRYIWSGEDTLHSYAIPKQVTRYVPQSKVNMENIEGQ